MRLGAFSSRIKETRGNLGLIEAEGEIDICTSPDLGGALETLIVSGKRHLIVNLQKVKLMDSTGLGVLVGKLQRVRGDQGSVTVICPNPRVRRIFDMTGLAPLFRFCPDEQTAWSELENSGEQNGYAKEAVS